MTGERGETGIVRGSREGYRGGEKLLGCTSIPPIIVDTHIHIPAPSCCFRSPLKRINFAYLGYPVSRCYGAADGGYANP